MNCICILIFLLKYNYFIVHCTSPHCDYTPNTLLKIQLCLEKQTHTHTHEHAFFSITISMSLSLKSQVCYLVFYYYETCKTLSGSVDKLGESRRDLRTEDQAGKVQRDEGETCGFKHVSSPSAAAVRLGGKCPVSPSVPAASGRDETQLISSTCLATPAQKLKTHQCHCPASKSRDSPRSL